MERKIFMSDTWVILIMSSKNSQGGGEQLPVAKCVGGKALQSHTNSLITQITAEQGFKDIRTLHQAVVVAGLFVPHPRIQECT